MTNILARLNEAQLGAVTNAARQVLVLAGAGSGKTRTASPTVYCVRTGVKRACQSSSRSWMPRTSRRC
jgi:hypothetical protein